MMKHPNTIASVSICRRTAMFMVAALLPALLAGCAKNESVVIPEASTISSDPVTIKIWNSQVDDVNQRMFIEPVKKKYPNLTLEFIKNQKGSDLRDLVTAGNIPDLIYLSNIQMTSYLDLGVFEDIAQHTKKANIDLSKFRQATLDSMRASAPNGELYGLPFAQNYEVLYYNKGIFDRFGVSYPKDGMMWDDAIEVAKKVTRMDAGVQYMGLGIGHVHYLAFPLALPYVDDKAGKAIINNDKWKEIFELTRRILDIPGNEKALGVFSRFSKEKDLAMVADWTQGPIQTMGAADNTLNWDVAQLINKYWNQYRAGQVDVNTALRGAEEETNQFIRMQKK